MNFKRLFLAPAVLLGAMVSVSHAQVPTSVNPDFLICPSSNVTWLSTTGGPRCSGLLLPGPYGSATAVLNTDVSKAGAAVFKCAQHANGKAFWMSQATICIDNPAN